MSKKIVILGVTGNIGSKLASQLLQAGHQVIGVSRHENKVQEGDLKRVDFRKGELSDAGLLTSLFKEADAVFAMIPPSFSAPDNLAYQRTIGEAIAQAVRDSGIQYVVNLSSQGGDLDADTGPILGVHEQELRLNQIPGVHVLHLRPGYFFENLLANIPMIQHMGIIGSALRPDLAFPWIATQDIAQAAARALESLNFSGKSVQDLLGPRDVSMAEATQLIGKAIGKPELPYVQFSYEDGQKGMEQVGMSPSIAYLYTEMSRGANEKGIFNRTQRSPENTTPTTLESFIQQYKGAFLGERQPA